MVVRVMPARSAVGQRYARGSAFVAALNAEWIELVSGSAGVVSDWRSRHRALMWCRDLEDVLEAVRVDPDPSLAALLAEARQGCRTAARTVLQAILGKLVLMAQRSRTAGVDDFVSAAWCRITSYPLDRRPHRIAANLTLDSLKDATRITTAATGEEPVPWPPGDHLEEYLERRTDRHPPGVRARDVIATAVGLRVISPETGRVLVSVYVDGLSSSGAALRHGTTPELVRYHCSQAARKMRGQADHLLRAA